MTTTISEPIYYPIEAIHWAGMNDNNLPDLKSVLNCYPEYVHTRNTFQDSLLTIAARVGNFEIVKFLVEETDIDINLETIEGNAFMVALKSLKYSIANYLIEKNINVNMINDNNENCLFLAAQLGQEQILKSLLAKGLNINQLNNRKENILFTFFDNYISHQSYSCFELISQNMDSNVVLMKNNDGINIFEHIECLSNPKHQRTTVPLKEEIKKIYSMPLFLLKNDHL